jgi:hypothetical protein
MIRHKKLFYTYTIIALNSTLLIISIASFYIYFKDTYNSNDLNVTTDIHLKYTSLNSFIVDFILYNYSDRNIEGINAYVDVYNKDMRLISSGKTLHFKPVNLNSQEGIKTEAKLYINEDYRNMRFLMIIPYSKEGTGKIMIFLLS